MATPWEKYTDDVISPAVTKGSKPWEKFGTTPEIKKSTVKRQAGGIVTNTGTWDEYEQTGTGEDFLGVPIQKGITEEGETRSYLTPAPMEYAYNVPGIGPVLKGVEAITGEGSIQRTVGGGVLESIKAPLELIELLMEGVGLDPNDEKYIRENFPTMPADNNTEKLIQEIISILIGSGVGGTVGVKLGGLLGKGVATVVAPMLHRLAKKDPVNAQKKIELALKGLLGFTGGEVVGPSITTPSDVEPLSEEFGVMPQTDDNLAGNMVDNLAMSAAIKTLGQLFKLPIVAQVTNKIVSGIKAKQPEAVMLKWLQNLDPNITPDIGGEEIARRATILAEVIQKHQTFKATLEGSEIPIDATTSMAMGAQEYIRRSYGYLERQLGAKGFQDFVDKETQAFMNRIIVIKQGLKDTQSVAKSDANLVGGIAGQFKKGAAKYASEAQGNLTGQNLAQPAVDDLQAATGAIDAAKAARDTAIGTRQYVYDKNHVIQLLEQAKRSGSKLPDLTGEQLYEALLKDKAARDAAFDQVPSTPVDPMELAEVVKQAGDITNDLEELHVPATAGGMRPVDDVEELARQYEENGTNDINYLLNEIRPSLSRRITAAYDAGEPDKAAQLIALRDGIDGVIGKNTDPNVRRAFDAAKKFGDTWYINSDLQRYVDQSSSIRDYGGRRPAGQADLFQKGYDILLKAKDSPRPEFMQDFVNALGSIDPNANENMTQALITEGLRMAVKLEVDGATFNRNLIFNALDPYLNAIRNINPKAYTQLSDAMEELRMADTQLVDKERAIENSIAVFDDLRDQANRSAARYFIAGLTGNSALKTPQVSIETGGGFKRLFDSPESVNVVTQLLQEMTSKGDMLAVDGVKAEMLRYLQDRYFTSKGLAMDAEGKAIREESGARLTQALEGNSSNDLALIEAVFGDEPEVATTIKAIMELGNLSLNLRTAKPNPGGSNTVMDTSIKQTIDALSTIIFGQLSREGAVVRKIGNIASAGVDMNRQNIARELLGMLSVDTPTVLEALKQIKGEARGTGFAQKWEGKDGTVKGTKTPRALGHLLKRLSVRMTKAYTKTTQSEADNDQTNEAIPTDNKLPEGYYMDETGYIRKQGVE